MQHLSAGKIIPGLVAFAVVFLCVCLPAARADMGIIVPEPVKVDEPGQTAFIAFNGQEEILLLQADLKGARSTAALQFTPFPSPPEVELTPEDAFARLEELLAAHRIFYWKHHRDVELPAAGPGEGEPVQVISHQKLDVHDVTVVEVTDASRFAVWVRDYFQKQGWPLRELTEEEEAVVADYCRRDFKYFVIDRVEIGETVRSLPPLVFRFATPALYYPLKVTNLFGGEGEVQLVVCSEKRLLARLPLSFLRARSEVSWHLWEGSSSALVEPRELAGVAPRVEELFSGKQVLQVFRYRGELSFCADVWADPREVLVEVNGRPLELDIPPELVAGTCLVPARAVWEALGAAVTWDAARREVVVAADGMTLRLPVDPVVLMEPDPATGQEVHQHRHAVYLNGERRDLSALAAAYVPDGRAPEVALRITGGRLLLPVRLVAGLLGARVNWDSEEWKVSVEGR